ncbi:helix-turn-helix domain-containing protein [Clostridium brassicae]|uniref:Helix-turn-helix transcriptional regulator n=1 Tax=Clostridium brassicae TaxID=2999072 RepID=A0ABT4D9C0_9CLOT|nr:helix-turn-helix transcriptional regulator [Clostridium brassicae]MCY6958900.1 helix-turn-helix transcriptional regulator [Clostridium brassicae]
MFGDILKDLREDREMTQEELGKLLCVTKQAVYTYEKGENEPTMDALIKIADIFDVSLDYLLGRTKQKENFHINNELFLRVLNDRHKKKFLLDICKNLNDYNLTTK